MTSTSVLEYGMPLMMNRKRETISLAVSLVPKHSSSPVFYLTRKTLLKLLHVSLA